MYRRVGGPQDWSGWAENLAPPGFDPRTVQPSVGIQTEITQICVLIKKINRTEFMIVKIIATRKQAAQKSDGVRFNLRKLNDLEVTKQYQIENTNRFAALENMRMWT